MTLHDDTTPPADPTTDAPAAPDTNAPPAADTGPASPLDAINAALADPVPADDTEAPTADTPPADGQAQAPAPDPKTPPAAPDANAPPATRTDLDLSEGEIDTLFKGRGKERVKAMHAELRDLRPLRDQVKELEPLRERAGQADAFERAIQDTGLTPENYSRVLTAAAYMNSGDPNKMRQAHAFMEAQTADLARRLGIQGGGYDPVANDPELSAAVANGHITPELARQFAAERGQGQVQAQRQQAQEREAAVARAEQQSVADMTAFGNNMAAADPHYDYRVSMLAPAIPAIRLLPAPQRLAALQAAYRAIPAPAAPMAPAAPVLPAALRPAAPPLAGAMPLRATGAAGGGMVAKPKSALDAINISLGASNA